MSGQGVSGHYKGLALNSTSLQPIMTHLIRCVVCKSTDLSQGTHFLQLLGGHYTVVVEGSGMW